MLFIPIGTDAPLYHPPIMTGVLIVANIVCFMLQLTGGEAAFDPFMLHFGTINPIQWVTNSFLHADWLHLVGNMIFLGLFGVIVEGKIGWYKFLGIYLLCGTLSGATIQLLELNGYGAGLGASDAIFALIAIALIWAPENQVKFLGVFWYYLFHFEVSVLVCCAFYLAKNFLFAWLGAFEIGTAMAHLIGAVFGGAVGFAMVMRNMVDCEGFDLISIFQGRRGEARPLTKAQLAEQAQEKAERREEKKRWIQDQRNKIGVYIEQGHYELALHKLENMTSKHRNFEVPDAWRLRIIKGLCENKSKRLSAIPVMEDYIDRYTELRDQVILNLSRLVVTEQQKPRKAIQLLKKLNTSSLDQTQKVLFNKIARRAKQMIDEGVMELED